MEGLTEGRIVHFVLDSGEHRPAIVLRVWRMADGTPPENGCCNLTVFRDWSNDNIPGNFVNATTGQGTALQWSTSVLYSEEPKPGTWHWIEKA